MQLCSKVVYIYIFWFDLPYDKTSHTLSISNNSTLPHKNILDDWDHQPRTKENTIDMYFKHFPVKISFSDVIFTQTNLY